jgi:AcrR family transcriptional regulator
MPHPRWSKLPPEKQARIVAAAARAFAEHGMDGASINRILADAGLSKGAAYYYFEDKADLFATVALHCWERFIEHASFSVAHLTAKDFWPRVEELMRHACEHMTSDPVMTMIAKTVWHSDQGSAAGRRVATFTHAWIGEVVCKGQALQVIRTDLPAELLIAVATAVDQATDRWTAEHLDRIPAAQLTGAAMAVFHGIRDFLRGDGRPEP